MAKRGPWDRMKKRGRPENGSREKRAAGNRRGKERPSRSVFRAPAPAARATDPLCVEKEFLLLMCCCATEVCCCCCLTAKIRGAFGSGVANEREPAPPATRLHEVDEGRRAGLLLDARTKKGDARLPAEARALLESGEGEGGRLSRAAAPLDASRGKKKVRRALQPRGANRPSCPSAWETEGESEGTTAPGGDK